MNWKRAYSPSPSAPGPGAGRDPRGRGDRPRRAQEQARSRAPQCVTADDGVVTLAGRQVSISRPRVRSADRTSQIALPTYELVGSTEMLGLGLGADAGQSVHPPRRNPSSRWDSTSRPRAGARHARMSRRFVAATETALDQLMSGRSVESRPRGHDGRRSPFWRPSVRGGHRDRHRRRQTPAGRGAATPRTPLSSPAS